MRNRGTTYTMPWITHWSPYTAGHSELTSIVIRYQGTAYTMDNTLVSLHRWAQWVNQHCNQIPRYCLHHGRHIVLSTPLGTVSLPALWSDTRVLPTPWITHWSPYNTGHSRLTNIMIWYQGTAYSMDSTVISVHHLVHSARELMDIVLIWVHHDTELPRESECESENFVWCLTFILWSFSHSLGVNRPLECWFRGTGIRNKLPPTTSVTY